MKRVLVLSYYYPPLGLSGVQRITKFVKYLPTFGWNPTVITAKPYSYFAFDETLDDDVSPEVEVIRTSSLDPTRWRLKKGTVSIPAEQQHSRLRFLSNRLFVPDNKTLWIPFARRAAARYIEENQVDLIFSTAPPFSSQLLAVELGAKYGIPVVTDYRDNWVGNPRKVYASEKQKKLHTELERTAIIGSDHVVTINDYIKRDLIERTKCTDDKISVMPQGYDPEDFSKSNLNSGKDGKVTFVHSGVFYDAQKPDTFLQAFALARRTSKTVHSSADCVFIGLVPDNFSTLINKLEISSAITSTGYLNHTDALAILMSSQVPWLTIGHQDGEEQISTGKLAEYIGTRKPILGLVPHGDAYDSLVSYGDGYCVDPDDVEGVAKLIVTLTDRFVAGTTGSVNEAFVDQLNRKYLTQKLASIFDKVIAGERAQEI